MRGAAAWWRLIATQAISRGAHHNRDELGEFLFRVRTHFADRSMVIVEVGSGPAGGLYAWGQVAGRGGRVIGVGQPDPMGPLLDPYGATFVDGDPADERVRRRVLELVEAAGGLVDLLVIDGVGTLEAIRADWWGYGPLVRPDGIVAITGTALLRGSSGPWRFWHAMRDSGQFPEHRAYEIDRGTECGISYVIL